MIYKISDLYDLKHTLAADYLSRFVYPWEALSGITDMLFHLGASLPKNEYDEVKPGVWVHKTAHVYDSAFLGTPCIIGAGSEVRHGAFIRGSALVGRDAVVGNSVELKNVILFDHVETPHYNYVGDSILGFYAHMGAGSITSNVKADRQPIVVKDAEEQIETGLKKIGAMLGDHVEVGCNAVLNPGTVVGRDAVVYPLSMVRGVVPADHIYKNSDSIVPKTQ